MEEIIDCEAVLSPREENWGRVRGWRVLGKGFSQGTPEQRPEGLRQEKGCGKSSSLDLNSRVKALRPSAGKSRGPA